MSTQKVSVRINYFTVILTVFGVVGMFGQYIFPKIPSVVCGGASVPATIQFQDKLPNGEYSKSKVWLIEETDAGFYYLPTEDSKKAVFIPRSVVTAIYYGK